MSAVELLYGQRPGATVEAQTALDTTARDELVLRDVEIHYCLFELPMASVVPRLPESLHPSVPAVIGLTVWRCHASPLGAFSLAYVGVACRTGIKPRHFIHGAFCNQADVGTWLGSRYGLHCQLAKVHSLETYDRIHSRVELDGRPILDLVTQGAQPLVGRGAMVKYSPILNAARIGDEVALIQMETSFDFKRVLRGVPHADLYDAGALGDVTLRAQYPISGTFAVADVALHPARFKLDVSVPAEHGGARKI